MPLRFLTLLLLLSLEPSMWSQCLSLTLLASVLLSVPLVPPPPFSRNILRPPWLKIHPDITRAFNDHPLLPLYLWKWSAISPPPLPPFKMKSGFCPLYNYMNIALLKVTRESSLMFLSQCAQNTSVLTICSFFHTSSFPGFSDFALWSLLMICLIVLLSLLMALPMPYLLARHLVCFVYFLRFYSVFKAHFSCHLCGEILESLPKQLWCLFFLFTTQGHVSHSTCSYSNVGARTPARSEGLNLTHLSIPSCAQPSAQHGVRSTLILFH